MKIFLDADGIAAGFWPELLAHIAKKENWTLDYVQGTWDECLERLRDHRIDLFQDVAFTEDRARNFCFSKVPVLNSWSRVYVAGDNSDIHSIVDLGDKRIAF